MLEELKEMAELISKVEIISKQLDEIYKSPLVSFRTSAYAFLLTASTACDRAVLHLGDLYKDMKFELENLGKLS